MNLKISAIDKHRLKNLQASYAGNNYVFLKNFISEGFCKFMKEALCELESKRVHCRGESSWMETTIPSNHEVYSLLFNSVLTDFILQVYSNPVGQLTNLLIWRNIYTQGEYIDKHTDTAGDVQMVVCLHTNPVENGGILHVSDHGKDIPIVMNIGDALLFNATQVPHYTTPIKVTAVCDNPTRCVLVLRCFIAPIIKKT